MTKAEFDRQVKEFTKRIGELKNEISVIERVRLQLQKEFANTYAPIKAGDLFEMRYGKTARRYRMQYVVSTGYGGGYEGQAVHIRKDGSDGEILKVYSWQYEKAKKI